MAIHLDVVMGEQYMRPQAKGDVIALLRALAQPAHEKRWLYGHWARQVGVPVRIEDLDQVAAAGRPARAGERGGAGVQIILLGMVWLAAVVVLGAVAAVLWLLWR